MERSTGLNNWMLYIITKVYVPGTCTLGMCPTLLCDRDRPQGIIEQDRYLCPFFSLFFLPKALSQFLLMMMMMIGNSTLQEQH